MKKWEIKYYQVELVKHLDLQRQKIIIDEVYSDFFQEKNGCVIFKNRPNIDIALYTDFISVKKILDDE